MLYYYHTHRRELEPDEYQAGRRGYTGILQEMMEGIPRVGPYRLQRKLSVDINEIITGAVRDMQIKLDLIARIEAVAVKYSLPLYCQETEKREKSTDRRPQQNPMRQCSTREQQLARVSNAILNSLLLPTGMVGKVYSLIKSQPKPAPPQYWARGMAI